MGGRLLAWVGGVAVVLGVAFFVAMAINRGWIDEETRIVMAALGSLAFGVVGVWLHERQGQTQASMAMVGTSIAALYLTLTAASQLYDLIPTGPALTIAFVIGTAATAVALRWDSVVIAGLGIIGALLAPVLVDAGTSDQSVAFVLIAFASAVGVLLWRRWDWLAVTAFIVSAPQVVAWIFDAPPAVGLGIAAGLFWLLGMVAALGYELRAPATSLRTSSSLLLTANAATAAFAYWAFKDIDQHVAADAWIASLATAQLAFGAAALNSKRMHRDVGLVSIALGVLLADLALGLIVEGPALAAGWAFGALPFVLIKRTSGDGVDLRRLALVWQLGLGLGRVLLSDAEPSSLIEGADDLLPGIVALSAVAVAYFVCARLIPDDEHSMKSVLDAVGLGILAYLAAYALDGPELVATWSLLALVVAAIGTEVRYRLVRLSSIGFIALAALHVLVYEAPTRAITQGTDDMAGGIFALVAIVIASFTCGRILPEEDDAVATGFDVTSLAAAAYLAAFALSGAILTATWAAAALAFAILATRVNYPLALPAAVGFLALAAGHVLIVQAPPDSLLYGADDLQHALAGIAAVAAAAFGWSQWGATLDAHWKLWLQVLGTTALIYLGSVAIVSHFQPETTITNNPFGPGQFGSGLDIDIRQKGQALLSAFWAAAGFAGLVFGLTRDNRPLRLGGFTLLTLAIGKVFLYDFSTLDQAYRVLSFIALGILLLAGALAYQRIRPPRAANSGQNAERPSPG
ncbi:MAG: DUF2339 domain-containing protein [Solirubrobacterales bacterium]